MSLAYKLWKIGSVLSKEDIQKALQEVPEDNGKNYININFDFDRNNLESVSWNRNAISKDKLFFSKKIGGTSNAYYLYPNITVLNDLPIERIGLLENTLRYGTIKYCNEENKKIIDTILPEIIDLKKQFENKINNKMSGILKEISKLTKDDYWLWFSINGKTIYEIMPEVFDNWFQKPVEADKIKKGVDVFSNKEAEVGYKPEVKVFSYDQYHDSLNYRIIENLPLCLESARNIKYAWMYILENLVFYYKGLQYIIIPNLITDDKNIYKTILERLIKANEHSKHKRTVLEELKNEEEKFKKNIEKVRNNETEEKIKNIESKIDEIDKGIIQEFNEQILSIDEHLNSITIDYIFTSINRTNLSFEIKGSIEDVIPSQMSQVVKEMQNFKIDDLIKLGSRDRKKTLLQDYFGRNELYFVVNRSSLNNANKIFEERLFLTKLLLTDVQIKFDDLLDRLEFNRLYNYEQKKRVLKDGTQEWIEYHRGFVEKENNLIAFFKKINKIKEV